MRRHASIRPFRHRRTIELPDGPEIDVAEYRTSIPLRAATATHLDVRGAGGCSRRHVLLPLVDLGGDPP
jgi:hypothetical protein